MSDITGWGRETWNSGAWNTAGAVLVTGVEAQGLVMEGFGRLGWSDGPYGSSVPVSISSEHVIIPSGVVTASAIGSYTVKTVSSVTATSVSIESQIGTQIVTGKALITQSGIGMAMSIGSYTTHAAVLEKPSGMATSSAIGNYDIVIPEEISPSGRQADFALGSVSVVQGGGVMVSVNETKASFATGTVDVKDMVVGVTGIESTLSLGAYVQWGRITPTQNASWNTINPSQSASWTKITPTQDAEWTPILDKAA